MGVRTCSEITCWKHASDLHGDSNTRLPFFPPLRQGELIYSAVARYHCLIGRLHAGITLRSTIGRTKSKFVTAGAPSYISTFSKRLPLTHPNLNVEQLIRQHTVIPMLGYFLDPASRNALQERFLSDSSSAGAFASLGLTRFPHMAFHRSLAFCRTCAIEDAANYGSSHWHVEHQIPGVFSCLKHSELLAIGCTTCGLSISSPYSLDIPRVGCVRAGHDLIPVKLPECIDPTELADLSTAAAQIQSRPDGMPGNSWVENFKAVLASRGFLRLSVIDRRMVHKQILERFSLPLLQWAGCVDHSGSIRESWLSQLLNWRTRKAPLSCLILVLAFSDDVEAFESSVRELSASDTRHLQVHVWNSGSRETLAWCENEIAGLRRSAIALGTTVQSVLNGHTSGHRSDQRKRELFHRISQFIVRAVNKGLPLSAVAMQLTVKKSVVLARLGDSQRSDLDSRAFKEQRERAQSMVLDYLSRHPNASRSELGRSLKSHWKWLKLYDSDWLDAAVMPGKRPGLKPIAGSQDEDDKLAARLRSAAIALLQRRRFPRLTSSSIATEARVTSRERKHVLKLRNSAAVISEYEETAEEWWKRRLTSYVSIAGREDPILTSNRIKQEHHLPMAVPKWMQDFMREECLRQGFEWTAKRTRHRHASREHTKSRNFRQLRQRREAT